MKNILFNMLPLLAAVLFATSCSKDDGSDNTVVPDTTTSVTTASNDASTIDKPAEPSETVQVQYDENGVPYIPFYITIGREDSESLSKVGLFEEEDKYVQKFTAGDKLRIKGKDIEGELTVELGGIANSNPSAYAGFSGTLRGEGVLSITNDTELEATLFNSQNKGTPLSEPTAYSGNNLSTAVAQCSYLTTTFKYGDYSYSEYSQCPHLKQNTEFLVFDMEYSAKVVVKYKGTDYPFYLLGNGDNFNSGETNRTIIAVPDGAYVRSSFLKNEREINIEKDNGVLIHTIKRLMPNFCTRGTFSISEDKQVFIMPGNFVYGISSEAVGHEQPWDINFGNGDDVGVDHASMNGHGYVDLFGWGTWCEERGNLLKTTSYHSNYEWAHLHLMGGYDDVHAPAMVMTDFYTLTADEWYYLLYEREMNPLNVQSIRYVRASVKKTDGTLIPGLVLFPDCFDYNTTNPGNLTPYPFSIFKGVDAKFDENIIEADSWEYFEVDTRGAVFLPCAGRRDKISNNHVTGITYSSDPNDAEGWYWTSTACGSNEAEALKFDKNSVIVSSETARGYGLSVRLVRDLR